MNTILEYYHYYVLIGQNLYCRDGDLKRKPVKKEMVDEQRQRWGKRVQMAPNRTLDLTDTADSVVDAVAPSE